MSRRTATTLLVLYSLGLAVVLLNPSAAIPTGVVSALTDLAHAIGLPRSLVTGARVEFVTNAVMLMPLSALGSVVWPRTNWRDWTAYTFVIAGSVETVQAVLYPDRSATFVDVVSNTLGGLLGAGLVALVRWRAARAAGGADQ